MLMPVHEIRRVAESIAERLVTLPLHPRQTHEALDYLIESIKALAVRR